MMKTNPRWRLCEWYQEKTQLYRTMRQSIMESRLGKTHVMIMRAQKQETKTIRPIERKDMLTPKLKIREQWDRSNKALLEQTEKTENATENKQTDKYVQNQAKEITQLIGRFAEIPEEEMDLNGDGRKKLDEITIDYPPESRRMEQGIH